MSIPDNYSQWEANELWKEKLRERLPVCEDHECGKQIDDDHYFMVDGEILCEACMICRYRRNTEDFVF